MRILPIVLNENITDNVCGAVWLATLIMTYVEKNLNQSDDIYFKQVDIRKTAQEICNKKINSARTSQWCNGNHPNNTYNYLSAKFSKRRLAQIGEFMNFKEYPEQLLDFDVEVFEIIHNGNKVNYRELFDWYRINFSKVSGLSNINSI